MPPKGVSRAVSKKCPQCSKQNPVACRCCPCGYKFFEERRKSTTSNNSEHDDNEELVDRAGQAISPLEGKRRSERVKREKPNFYDSLEYDNKMRKARKDKQRDEQSTSGRMKRERKVKNSSDFEDDEDDEPIKEKKKRKKKKGSSDRKEEEIDEDIMAGITAEKEHKFGIVLSDINTKLLFNNPLCFA